MNPLALPDEIKSRISDGVLIAANVCTPPSVTFRVWIGPKDESPLSLGPVPDISKLAVIAAAISTDAKFVDVVCVNGAELKGGVQ
jgi:hypothetical protein